MMRRRILGRALASTVAVMLAGAAFVGTVTANHVTGGGQSFTFLQPGFTQDIFGVAQHFVGGVAFAPDGDPWVDDCANSGSHLHRYDAQSSGLVVNTTPLHNESIHTSNAGCGLMNHSAGDMYTNTTTGVIRLDDDTGAQIGGPFGPGGNALGIAEDPETGLIIYVGGDGTLHSVDAAFTTTAVWSTAVTGNFVDGIAFDPTGDFLFVANRTPSHRLTILNGDTGALIQHVPMGPEPDGISFHASTPKFVVTNNTDGTMTRFDFAGDDYTQVPVQSVFASGGFRGDLSQVGADGCIYLTQAGTRYNDGTVTQENSLVRICGGFAPPVIRNLALAPATATNQVGSTHTVTATLTDSDGDPVAAEPILFSVSGAHTTSGSGVTDVNGEADFTYPGTNLGNDSITACHDANDNAACDDGEPTATVTKTWVEGDPASLVLTPETDTNTVDDQHCVTATVRDAFNNPTPGITVEFSVTGSVTTSGSAVTNASGQAEFCYTGPGLPGADTISAFADTDGDGVNDAAPADPEDTAAKAWEIPASDEDCRITGGGWIITAAGDRATFGGNANGAGPAGEQEYQDHGPAAAMNVHSIDILSVTCSDDGTMASIFGTATIDGAGTFDFRIDVTDPSGPGADTYRIRLSNGYDSGVRDLRGGNIVIH